MTIRFRDHDDRPLPAEYEWLVGSKCGLVQRLSLWYPERAGPQVYLSSTGAPDVGALRGDDTEGMAGGGQGVTPREALRSAVGETVERYCLYWPDENRIERATYDDLRADRTVLAVEKADVAPRQTAAAPRQTDVAPRQVDGATEQFDAETPLSWTPGTDLLTTDETYVPAQLVWSRTGPLADEPRYFPGTTNGMAAGPTLREAVLGGLYELAERDGLMTTWLGQSPPRKVDPAQVPGLRERIDDLLPTERFSVHLLALESLVEVPTYGVALVNDREEYPKFVFGSAAGADPRATVEEALVEAGQGWRHAHELGAERDPSSVGLDDVSNFDDNVLLYGRPENFEHISFLVEGEATGIRQSGVRRSSDRPSSVRQSDAAVDELATCLDRYEAADCSPVVVDVTTPDVAAAGIRVVQALAPRLLPLVPPSVVPEGHPRCDPLSSLDVPHPYP